MCSSILLSSFHHPIIFLFNHKSIQSPVQRIGREGQRSADSCPHSTISRLLRLFCYRPSPAVVRKHAELTARTATRHRQKLAMPYAVTIPLYWELPLGHIVFSIMIIIAEPGFCPPYRLHRSGKRRKNTGLLLKTYTSLLFGFKNSCLVELPDHSSSGSPGLPKPPKGPKPGPPCPK